MAYLRDGIEGVGALGRVEADVEHAPRQLAADQHRLHALAHGLLGSQGQVEAALRAALAEGDVVLDVHRNGHQASNPAAEHKSGSDRQLGTSRKWKHTGSSSAGD